MSRYRTSKTNCFCFQSREHERESWEQRAGRRELGAESRKERAESLKERA